MPLFSRLKYTLNTLSILALLLAFITIGSSAKAEADALQITDPTSITEITNIDPLVTEQPLLLVPINDPAATITSDLLTTNDTTQNAVSGDNTVANNEFIADTSTGSANNDVDILNISSSNQSLLGTEPVLYVNTILGSSVGDITVNPLVLGMPTTLAQNPPITLSATTLNIISTNQIDNSLLMSSNTGNIVAKNNDSTGDVVTGNATNSADIINIANTIVGYGNFFIGLINIYGDLHGNIIIPSPLLDALSASVSSSTNLATNTNISNNTNIINDTDMIATSGNTIVSENDSVGAISSGNSTNKISILNYTGQHLFTNNTLLIIVNVMGKWVGLLLGSPETNVAAISSPSAATTGNQLNTLNISTSTTISNSLKMTAKSGNTIVTNNDDVGSVTSGDATNDIRILNISNTVVNLSNWFGILFINILGNWYGSVSTFAESPVTPFSSKSRYIWICY